jgi:hypothetical protein
VSPRTPTLPPDDATMWRRLLSRAHPDAGGDHELFIWTMATRDAMCGGELVIAMTHRGPGDRDNRDQGRDRVPFDRLADFEVLTDRALAMADAVAEPFGFLLRQVADCQSQRAGLLHGQQRRGATYKQLAAIGHRVDMTKAERGQWYRIAESVPLSQRHAAHILNELDRRAA